MDSRAERALSVLAAEDNRAFQEIVKSILGHRGHRIEIVNNGQAAVERIELDNFDVVLMDVHMPQMDGLTAASRIRQLDGARRANIPIIAMTAHSWQCNRATCLAAGMDDFLVKPFGAAELVRVVEWYGNQTSQSGQPARDSPDRSHGESTADALTRFDKASAVARLGGDSALFERISRKFRDKVPAIMREIQAAANRGDSRAISSLAHHLGDGAATLYAGNTVAAAASLERAADAGDGPAVQETLGELESTLATLLTVLERELG